MAQLGIKVGDNEIITGDELKELGGEELAQRVKTIRLFARTTPDQKLELFKFFYALRRVGR